MALDEHRAKFKVCQWQRQDPDLKRCNTIDQTPTAQIKRGVQRFGLFGKKDKSEKAQLNGHNSNGLNGVNGNIEKHDYHNGGILEAVNGETKKDIEQKKLEQYFEALDATRKKRHKVETDVLEVWFM
jgi:hypothetical protein